MSIPDEQPAESQTQLDESTSATDALRLEVDRQRLRADEAEDRIAELERQLREQQGGAATATEPTAADRASLEQEGNPPVVPPPARAEAFATAPTAADAASMVQQDPAPTGPELELTAAQQHSVDAPPPPPPAEDDPVAVIAAGGHLDAAGRGCFCDRGGGHAPLSDEEAASVSQSAAVASADTTEPLSLDERAELEQLRAERAARTGA